jgi:PAS domain S-box-containing protein
MSATESPRLTEATSPPEVRTSGRAPWGWALPLSVAVVVGTAVLARSIEPAIYLYMGAGTFLVVVVAYVSSRMREVRAGAEAKQAEAWSLATELGIRNEELTSLRHELEQAKAETAATREEAERERERFALVAEASRVLAGPTDSERVVQKLAEVASRSFADFCAVDVLTTSGALSTTSSAQSGGDEGVEAASLKASTVLQNAVARAVGTKEPVIIPDVPATTGTGATLDASDAAEPPAVRSLIVVPLTSRGRILGAITFARSARRQAYEAGDLAVAQELAVRAALSLEATRLLQNARAEVADRVEAERALSESEMRFRTMADSAPVMIWTSDERGSFDFFNRRWLEFTGRPIEREVGDGWVDGVHADDRERCLTALSEALFAEQPFRVEFRLLRHDGSYRWILQSGEPRFSGAGECAGLIGSCIDIEDSRPA